MPCFNGMPFLADAIKSVLQQQYDDWELLIVDDGSSDESVGYCRALLEREPRARLLGTSGRRGAAHARNAGIAASRGRYIAFLDCDDVWSPQKLHTQIDFMQKRRLAFSWTSYDVIDRCGRKLRTQTSANRCTYRDLLVKRTVIGCLTAVYDKSLLGAQFMPAIRMRQDFGLWLRLLRICEERKLGNGGIAEPLASYRVHAAGMTSNKLLAAWYQWRLYRDIEDLPLWDTWYCFANYALRGVGERLEE